MEVISTSTAHSHLTAHVWKHFSWLNSFGRFFFFMIPKILDQFSIDRVPLTCSCGSERSG